MKANRWLNSSSYRRAKRLVRSTLEQPKRILDLVAAGQDKLKGDGYGRLNELRESINTVFRMLRAYARGHWRDISAESLMLVVASVIYLVMPIDGIPDFLLSLGFVDDAALLAWTFRSVADDFERFRNWELQQSGEVEQAPNVDAELAKPRQPDSESD